MKKIYYLIFLAIGISGCSVESIDSTEELSTADAKIKIQVASNPMDLYSGPNLKGTVSVWNDCDNLYVKLTPTKNFDELDVKLGIFEGGNLPSENGASGQMQYSEINAVNSGTDLLWTFNIENEGYDTESNLNLFFRGWGDWIGISALGDKNNAPTYHVFNFSFTGLDCGVCEESFSYVVDDENYTFNYTPSEDMKNAALVFTFAQSVAIEGLVDWTKNGSTMQHEMDLNACEEYSWMVTLKKDCSGNSQNSNVWTDFKVNDVSKKNENTPNLTQNCR